MRPAPDGGGEREPSAREHFIACAYQNFPGRTEADWQRAYYGQNLERLVEVKRTWDPDNLFRFPQSIPVTL